MKDSHVWQLWGRHDQTVITKGRDMVTMHDVTSNELVISLNYHSFLCLWLSDEHYSELNQGLRIVRALKIAGAAACHVHVHVQCASLQVQSLL